jgi:hypothetical protein
MGPGADPREAGANDQDINMILGHQAHQISILH